MYVRDYVYGLQSQQNPSACAQESELGAQSFLGVPKLTELKEGEQRKENVVVEASSTKLGYFVTHESYSVRNRKSTSLGFLENTLDQNKSCFRKCDELVPNGNFWSSPYSLFDSVPTNRPSKTIAYSEQFCSPKHDRASEPQQVSLPTIQQRKVEGERESTDFREQVIRSTAFRALTNAQSLPHRHVSPLSSAIRYSERTSGLIAQTGSKLRRLSPLRESSGNIHRSAEIEQHSLGKYSSFLQSNKSLCTRASCAKDTQRSQISLASIKAIK